jgi:hypothetical protein
LADHPFSANIVPINLMSDDLAHDDLAHHDLKQEYRLAWTDRQAITNPALEFGHNSLLLEVNQNGAQLKSGSKVVQKNCLVLHHFGDIMSRLYPGILYATLATTSIRGNWCCL